MAKYEVTILETLEKKITIEVEGDDPYTAIRSVEDDYKENRITLDRSTDLSGTSFNAKKVEKESN